MTIQERVEAFFRDIIEPALRQDRITFQILEVAPPVCRIRMISTELPTPIHVLIHCMEIEKELRRHIKEIEYLHMVP